MLDQQNKTTAIPGSYKFNKFSLFSQIGQEIDLTNMFQSMEIFEDIKSPTISGNITIADAIGLYNNFPIVAEETLSLDFQSNEDDVTQKTPFRRDYDVYKVSEKQRIKQDLDVYLIYFASPEFETNLHTKVSKAYNNSYASDIVNMLITEQYPNGLGFKEASYRKLNIEKTFYKDCFVIPYWTPFETIRHLCARSLPDANHNAANYVFFENRDGFNFVSLESLLKKEPVATFRRSVVGDSAKKKSTYIVEDFQIFDNQDVFRNINNGLYAGTLVTHDILKKKISTSTLDYLQNYNKTAHVDSNPLTSQKSKRNEKQYGNYRFYPTHFNMFNNMPENGNRAAQWILQNNSLLQQMMAVRIIIRVKGNSKTKVGDMVNFELMQRNPQNDQINVTDKYYSGKYLVGSIRHTITQDEYYQTIELIRESYRDRLATENQPGRPAKNV